MPLPRDGGTRRKATVILSILALARGTRCVTMAARGSRLYPRARGGTYADDVTPKLGRSLSPHLALNGR